MRKASFVAVGDVRIARCCSHHRPHLADSLTQGFEDFTPQTPLLDAEGWTYTGGLELRRWHHGHRRGSTVSRSASERHDEWLVR